MNTSTTKRLQRIEATNERMKASLAATVNLQEVYTHLTETYVPRHRSTVGERPLEVSVTPPIEMLAAAEHPDRRPGIPVPPMVRDFFPTHVPFNRG